MIVVCWLKGRQDILCDRTFYNRKKAKMYDSKMNFTLFDLFNV